MCLFANHCSSKACIMILPKLTFALLGFPFLSPLPRRWRFAVAPLSGFTEDLITAVIAEVSVNVRQHWKWRVITFLPFHCDYSILGAHAFTSKLYVFPYSSKKRYFSWSHLSIALYTGASIYEYKAYWNMNFSDVAPAKIIFMVILSFEVALVNRIVTKSNQTKVRKNL